MGDFEVLGVTCRIADASTSWQGQSVSGATQAGTARGASVSTPDGAELEVGLVRWEDGETDMQCLSKLIGPIAYDNLLNRVRISIRPLSDGRSYCELRTLYRSAPDALPTAHKASWEELDGLLGRDARAWLKSIGDVDLGTREQVFGDTSKRRFELAMAVRDDSIVPFFAAYVLVRVLPILRGFGTPGLVPAGAL